MPVESTVQSFSDALLPLADPHRAAPMRAYMRDQFEFLGIPTPERRRAVAALIRQPLAADDLLAVAGALWLRPQREFQYVAVDLLARQWKMLSVVQLEALLGLVRARSWWDTVDALAGVVGDVVKAARACDELVQFRMDDALVHDDKWVRRIAMLHQLGWRGATDTDRLYAYALTLAPEPDFFIRKAIGWALRDYARHDPEGVRAFLGKSGNRLSALTVREAGKHLGESR